MNMLITSLITIITFCLITLVTSGTSFRDPKVMLTCSSGPTTNVVNVSWYPVHENYDSLEDIVKVARFQFCKFEIKCENGYSKIITKCKRRALDLFHEWGSVPKLENFCTVTIKYQDIYDDDNTVLETTKNCYFKNPVVNVSVTPVNTSIMGELMMLECTVVTWSGLHDNVAIVWMTSNNESRRTTVQNINKSSVNSFTMYTDYYNISDLHLQDNGTEFSCQVETNLLSNSSTSNFILNLPTVWCTQLSAPESGIINCSQGDDGVPSYEDTCNFTCNTGYELTGSDTRTCQSDRSWNGTETMCRRVRCTQLSAPESGIINCLRGDDGVPSYEDTCNFTCNTGYELSGSVTRTCQSDRSWSGTEAVCRRVRCTQLPAPEGGDITCSRGDDGVYSYEDTCSFTCTTGYELTGSDTRTCQSDRSWNGTGTVCKKVRCTEFPGPESGTITCSQGDDGVYSYEDTCSFTCNTGYELTGSDTRTCQSNRSWNGTEATCRRVQCTELAAPESGTINCSLGDNGVPSYEDTCNFTCNTGYELAGSDTRTCQSDRSWNGTETTCRRVRCSELPAPDSGNINCSRGDDGVYSYEDTCSFTCNTGYELTGSDTRTCQSDRSWNGTEATCSRVQCVELLAPKSGNINCSQGDVVVYSYKDTCSFTCNTGYELAGSDTRTCQSDGSWNGTETTCKRGSLLVISILISSTIIIITVIAVIIICGTILLRNWNRQTEHSCRKLSNLTTLDNDYYSIVGIEELSTCEDIDGIVLQVETEDDSKEEYKAYTDYSFMLRSVVSPILTIGFKQKYKVSSQGNSQEILSAENSPGAYIHVKANSFDIGDSADENDDNDSTATGSGLALETSTSEQNHNLLSVDCDLVGQYVDDMSSSMVSKSSANTMISDQHLTVKQVSCPKSANEDYPYLYSNSEQSLSLAPRNGNSLKFDIEQCLQSTLASGEYLDELAASTQTDEPSPANDEDDTTTKDDIRSTSATGEYTDLSTSGKIIFSSEQILSQLPANDTDIPTLQVARLKSTREQHLDPVSVNGTVMIPTQQELPLKINKNGYVAETKLLL